MLKITIPAIEQFDEILEEFIHSKEQTLTLEHSLVSISKWESKWRKPFLSREEKTVIESIDYIKCMTITQNIDDKIYDFITNDNLNDVRDYIEAPMTATTFTNDKGKGTREIITSELIYYWMVSLNIPLDCQKWHLNRLLTLVNVCNVKNAPPKKTSRKETLSRNAAINASRKQALNTQG